MIAEHYVEYYGTLIAILLAAWPFLSALYNRSFSRFTISITARRRFAEVERIELFFRNIQRSRGDDQQRQIGLNYAMSLIVTGWSHIIQGTIIYLSSLVIMVVLVSSKLQDLAVSDKFSAKSLQLFIASIFLLAAALNIILRGQKRLRRGLDIRDALAGNIRFLDRASKRLSKIAATKIVDVDKIRAAEHQIEDARRYRGVDWLQLRI